MLKSCFIGLTFLLCLGNSSTLATHNQFSEIPQDNCVENQLKTLEASYGGLSTAGNKYNLYAIKDKKDWIFIVLDTTGYYSLKYPHKSATLVNQSALFTDGFCKIIESGLLKKVEKRENVADLTLFCYYELKKEGKKISDSLNYLEAEKKETEGFMKKVMGNFKPITGLFKKKK
ncbi:hypothetical protein GXP67_04775 [Rhodocytophaga rosea]|uniref:Uncharacterized protein n=1 Tax=Rhodocytophaga rosea TaxID=2704465 RepID=A0A6C0GDY1_9BACT|nr:hypothetical protein [Rhodocytophaga rosea]QHT66034.1 hypothetical protein GXP67_04775 [Rhodocytophaga rosea]